MSALRSGLERLLPKSPFVRSVSVLAGGTAAGQLLVLLSSPLLTRLYTPEDFGLLGLYIALLSSIGVLASLRYELAIPLPEDDEEAAHVAVLALVLVLGTTLLTTVVILSIRTPIAQALNAPGLADYLWLLPVGLLLMGTYQVLNYWAIRTQAFPVIARTRFMQGVGAVTVQIGGYALGPLALLLGHVAGQAAGTSTLGLLAVRKHRAVLKRLSLNGVLRALQRYRRFPIYSTWGSVLNTVSHQVPLLLLSAFFGATTAGIYLLAHRVLALPMQLIGKSIADVFFSTAAEANREGRLGQLVATTHQTLVHVAMPPMLLVVLTAPELFALVFGEPWRQAGQFAQWLAVSVYFQFVLSPISNLFALLEKQAHALALQILLLVSRTVALVVGGYLHDVVLGIALFAVGSAACYSIFLLWVIRLSGNSLCILWPPLASSLAWSIMIVVPVCVQHLFFENNSFLYACMFSASVLFIAVRYVTLLRKTS